MSHPLSKWIAGNSALRVTRGPSAASGARIAVVIMSLDSDLRTADAVRSIVDQDVEAEIVVVNTGKGTLAAVLGGNLARVTLVETSERQFVGGARNLGILFSESPIVAFLAADCLAAPGWLRARLIAHDRGHFMVASALLPAAGGGGRISSTAWASCTLTHTGRMPETPAAEAARYGLSYHRSLFERFGLFDDSLRVGEDTDFNRRCAGAGQPLWDPTIVTLHRYPQRFVPAAVEQYRRGRRSALYAREVVGRSPLVHLFHSIYRGWVVNRRIGRGSCARPAQGVRVRLLMALLFACNLVGVLSPYVAASRTFRRVSRFSRPGPVAGSAAPAPHTVRR